MVLMWKMMNHQTQMVIKIQRESQSTNIANINNRQNFTEVPSILQTTSLSMLTTWTIKAAKEKSALYQKNKVISKNVLASVKYKIEKRKQQMKRSKKEKLSRACAALKTDIDVQMTWTLERCTNIKLDFGIEFSGGWKCKKYICA